MSFRLWPRILAVAWLALGGPPAFGAAAFPPGRIRALEFHFEKDPSKGPSSRHRFSLKQSRRRNGHSSLRKKFKAWPEALVVHGLDRSGRKLFELALSDPRKVRVYLSDAQGHSLCREELLEKGDFAFAVPDLPGLAALKFFEPRWNGRELLLEPLSESGLP